MNISPDDLKAYDHFVKDRGNRTDMGPDFVGSMIKRLDDLIEDGLSRKKAPPKLKEWRRQRDHYAGVRRVMAAMNDGED